MYKVTMYQHGDYPNTGIVMLDTSSGINKDLLTGIVDGQISEPGSFTYSIAANSELYDVTDPLKYYISVEEDGEEIFWGRIISVQKNPLNFVKQITCEGALAFLLDSELEINKDGTSYTAEEYFRSCIAAHNAGVDNDPCRVFSIGRIQNQHSSERRVYKTSGYTQIQNCLKSELLDRYDGFLHVRRVNGSHVIDWVEQIGQTDPQPIQITQNLMSQTTTDSGEDIFTVMRPIGKDGVTPGLMIVSNAMLNTYGKIIRTVSFHDEETAEAGRAKASIYIEKLRDRLSLSGDIGFLDFHYLDGSKAHVRLGDVFTQIMGYEGTRLTAASVSRDIFNPENDKLGLKNDKDLMSSAAASGANSSGGVGSGGGSGAGSRFSGGSSFRYKFIHETDKDLSMAARNIELTAEEKISMNAKAIEMNSADIRSQSETWTSFTGTSFYQNKEHITQVAGKYSIDKDGNVLLEDGAEFKIFHDGVMTNVAEQIKHQDQSIDGIQNWVTEYEGTDIYQSKDHIAQVAGRYTVQEWTDPETGKKHVDLIIQDGTQLYQSKNGGSFALYDDGNLTAGILFSKMTDGRSQTQLAGNQILIGGPETQETLLTASKQYAQVVGTYVWEKDAQGNKILKGLDGSGSLVWRDGAAYGIWDSGNLTGGIMAEKVNGQTQTKIRGDRVVIGTDPNSNSSLADTMVIENGNLRVKYGLLVGSTTDHTSINGSKITSKDYQVSTGGKIIFVGSGTGEHYDVDVSTLQSMIRSASVSGNVLTLTPFYGDPITFSKATTLEGAWDSGKLTVNAYQTNNGIKKRVAQYFSSHQLALNGNGSSNFSVEMKTLDTGESGPEMIVRDSKYIYLTEVVDGTLSSVTASENSDGSAAVGSISTKATYDAGKSAGKADGRSEYKALVRTRFGSSSGGYYVEAYENNSGSASIPSSSISYKLALSGSTSSSKVQIQNTSGSKISNTPELSVGSLYTGGWDACYATRAFSATADSKTLSYGESVTVSASLKNSSGTTVSIGSRTYVAPADRYSAGKADGRSEYKALVRTRFGSSSGGYYVEAYENNSGSASIPSSSISYKLALSGSTSSSKVQIQNTSGSKISNTPELSVGSLYTGGWDACYATRAFSATANSKTLSYGESVTVSASLKNSSGTTVSMGSRTYVAPADRYADGWNAGAATSGLIYVSDTTGYSDQGVLPFESKIAPTYIDANGNRQIQKVFWRVPADSGGGGGDHSPAITEFTPGWTGNIGSRTKLKSIDASDIKSRTYILLTASCGGETKQYYITVN